MTLKTKVPITEALIFLVGPIIFWGLKLIITGKSDPIFIGVGIVSPILNFAWKHEFLSLEQDKIIIKRPFIFYNRSTPVDKIKRIKYYKSSGSSIPHRHLMFQIDSQKHNQKQETLTTTTTNYYEEKKLKDLIKKLKNLNPNITFSNGIKNFVDR